MSLDVYLMDNYCPRCERGDEVFTANVTHNLARMASEAGVYEAVWRPDEHGFTRAGAIGEVIRRGLALMYTEPARFIALNPENGWGSYHSFVPWLESYAAACDVHPDASVRVSR